MYCEQCGSLISDDARFCSKCGIKVKIIRQQCPDCGCLLKDEDIYCERCGKRLLPPANGEPDAESASDVDTPAYLRTFKTTGDVSRDIAVLSARAGGDYSYAQIQRIVDNIYANRPLFEGVETI